MADKTVASHSVVGVDDCFLCAVSVKSLNVNMTAPSCLRRRQAVCLPGIELPVSVLFLPDLQNADLERRVLAVVLGGVNVEMPHDRGLTLISSATDPVPLSYSSTTLPLEPPPHPRQFFAT